MLIILNFFKKWRQPNKSVFSVYTSLTLAEFLKNDSDFQSCMIYGSESSIFGLKMGGVQKMHLMMVSTTFLEKMSYHLEAHFSTLVKNCNLEMRKEYQILFGNPLAVKPRKINFYLYRGSPTYTKTTNTVSTTTVFGLCTCKRGF